MAIVSGIVSTCSVDDSAGVARDISADVFSATIQYTRNQQDITSLGNSAVARLGLLKDATVTLNGGSDFAANKAHDVFKADPTGTRTVSIVLANSAATFTAEMNLQDYGPTRAQDGSLTWTATLVNADGNAPVWS